MTDSKEKILIALAWCLAWGNKIQPQYPLETLQQMAQAIKSKAQTPIPTQLNSYVQLAEKLLAIPDDFQLENLENPGEDYQEIFQSTAPIGLVYGGATKIKSYVFTSAKLAEIRGASALLDKINLVDLPVFFGQKPDLNSDKENQDNLEFNNTYNIQFNNTRRWLNENFSKSIEPKLTEALIPELIIYSTGGNILAFCPPAFVDRLADAIEKRYTHETLIANSCAVGDTFQLAEIRFGLLQGREQGTGNGEQGIGNRERGTGNREQGTGNGEQELAKKTFWLDQYREKYQEPLVEAYFGKVSENGKNEVTEKSIKEQFFARKNFSELVGKLAAQFYQRRSGNEPPTKRHPIDNSNYQRSTKRYPSMVETHPYLKRGGGGSGVIKAEQLPGEPFFSEAFARKRLVGQIAKKDQQNQDWYKLDWQPDEIVIKGWITRWHEEFLEDNPDCKEHYYRNLPIKRKQVKEAQSLKEISDSSKGFVAYIYADGNSMGEYIRTKIKTPQQYQQFSEDIFEATKNSVYLALAKHLEPRQLKNSSSNQQSSNKNGDWVHPFEIITIGGDDVLIIVPADKALEIACTIGEKFEELLLAKGDRYQLAPEKAQKSSLCHRYQPETAPISKCLLSTSMGLLITADDTPIYYAEKLYSQLLKSAKKKAKALKKNSKYDYHGGTVDILTLKSVTMISSNLEAFRQEGLTKPGKPTLKLYGTPYTFHELKGLIATVKALKQSKFPRSQLYQIRDFLAQGKRTTILNYRYFKARLDSDKRDLLTAHFEQAWCETKDSNNKGNLAPWMSLKSKDKIADQDKTIYETIWRELLELYPFIKEETDSPTPTQTDAQEVR